MAADVLLSRLDRVRRVGDGRWIARCPAHADHTPSLSVRQLHDGRMLLHCFAQCATQDVLAAIGLEFDALFPEKPVEHAMREHCPFNAHDVLAAIAAESRIVVVASANIRIGVPLSDADHERLFAAAERIEEARRLANGER